MSKLSRRRFIFTAGATAVGTAILHGCATPNNTATSPSPAGSPAASPVVSGETPEVTTAKLGFIALTDAAPLIIAKEKGLFAKHGMPDVGAYFIPHALPNDLGQNHQTASTDVYSGAFEYQWSSDFCG